jgi:hypothetical protein
MVRARIEKIVCGGFYMYEARVTGDSGLNLVKHFTLGIDKTRMIDWATEEGAEEVTYKL